MNSIKHNQRWVLLYALAGLVGFFAYSCKEEMPDPPDLPVIVPGLFENGFFILNEGNFGSGNSRLDFYNRDSALLEDVYGSANSGLAAGDVMQSMAYFNQKYFLVVNNSGKVDVLDPENAALSGTIDGLVSPRYILQAEGNKAYVSDLFGGAIAIVNTQTYAVTGQIPTGGWSERMVRISNLIYAAIMTRDKILVIDPATDDIVDSLDTGREPEGLLPDGQGNLFVLSTGGFMEGFPELRLVNPTTGVVIRQWILGVVGDYVSDLAISPSGETVYWLGNNGIYRMASDAAVPPVDPWIASPAGAYLYSLDTDSKGNGEIVAGDAGNFVSSGRVFRFSESGVLLDSVKTGITPGAFHFVP